MMCDKVWSAAWCYSKKGTFPQRTAFLTETKLCANTQADAYTEYADRNHTRPYLLVHLFPLEIKMKTVFQYKKVDVFIMTPRQASVRITRKSQDRIFLLRVPTFILSRFEILTSVLLSCHLLPVGGIFPVNAECVVNPAIILGVWRGMEEMI